jgi:hypothetical protein
VRSARPIGVHFRGSEWARGDLWTIRTRLCQHKKMQRRKPKHGGGLASMVEEWLKGEAIGPVEETDLERKYRELIESRKAVANG